VNKKLLCIKSYIFTLCKICKFFILISRDKRTRLLLVTLLEFTTGHVIEN